MIGFILGVAMLIGLGVMALVGFGTVYLVGKGDLRPENTLREAVGELRWGYGVAVFVAPVTLAGLQEGDPVLGAAIGTSFLGLLFVMQWWRPI
jgi:hypothetical protein